MYKIKYVYDTGDSFRTEEDRIGIFEFSWNNLEIAKENLQRIKEHYEFYKNLSESSLSKKEMKKFLNEMKLKDWFTPQCDSCLILFTDDNKPCRINAPWCGYFERLNEVEIIEDNSGRKISFR